MTIALSILIVILLLYIIYVRRKTKQDIDEFAESIINRDFQGNPRFQSITDAFLNLAAEKEAQQHYLKEMLELVDTGILAYDVENHESLWMNDSFTTLLNIPHIKNINWLKSKTKTFSMNCSISR